MSVLEDSFTQFKDGGEICVHLIFELDDLLMCELILGVIKYLF